MPTVSSAVTNARVEPAYGTLTPSTALSVKRATLVYDRTWAPHIQGTLVCKALSAAGASNVDPRKGHVVRLNWSHTYNGTVTTFPLSAWLRSRANDPFTDEVTLTFASIESIMQDFVSYSGFTPAANETDYNTAGVAMKDMRWTDDAAYPDALKFPYFPAPTTVPDVFLTPAQASWTAGTTAWASVQNLGEAAGGYYRGTESALQLARVQPTWAADASTHVITGSDRVITATDVVSRDDPSWATIVAINFPNASGQPVDYGATGTISSRNIVNGIGPWKTYSIDRKGTVARYGNAIKMATSMGKRGRNLEVHALTDLACRPNMTYRVQYRGLDWTGTVQSVAFNHPEGTMDMKLNVIEP